MSSNRNTDKDDFDLLASELDLLTIEPVGSDKDGGENDEFEVIPLPACFNLDIPFDSSDGKFRKKEIELINSTKTSEVNKIVIEKPSKKAQNEKVKDAVYSTPDPDKLEISSLVQLKFDASPSASVERLVELGFANREENKRLLNQNGNNFEKVLEKLYNDRGTKWAEKRH
eukprot:GFUD01016726.1.p1 GENE.GFUD01016726.1~~GFUD01016726.1.p1  ORF type:complete len:171 (+),score=62.46 GFUD01016726.1:78-590(+)